MIRTPLALALLGLVLALPAIPARAEPAVAATDGMTLRRLPLTAGGWTLSGETARIDLPVYLDPQSTARPAELVLAFESAVSVMPEASTLVAVVNRQTIGRVGLGAGTGLSPAKLAIPPAVLKPGWNVLTLTANQRHRVDCSVDGTYELWTRIDPARSGLALATGATVLPGLAAIAGLSPDDAGRLPIRVQATLPGDEGFAAALELSAAAALLAGSDAPTVEFDRAAATGAGLDIAYGRAEALAALGFAPEEIPADGGPRFLAATPTHRASLVVTAGAAGIAPTLDRLAEAAASVGPAPRAGVSLGHDAASLTLADLGQSSEQFSGRLWSRRLDIRLPADTLVADYGSVTLRLSAGYAPGLDADDNLSLFVGGRLAATVPFGNASGAMIDNRRVELPLSAFRPGDNTVELVARATGPADAACAPRDQIAGNARFLILDQTSLGLPDTARAMRLPDLGATIGSGRTGAASGDVVRLALAADTPANRDAAATLYARMAVHAGHLAELDASLAPPADPSGRLVVGTREELPPDLLRTAGLAATTGLAASAGDGLFTGALIGKAHAATLAPAAASDPLIEEWRSRVGTPKSRWNDLFGAISATFGDFAVFLGLGDDAPAPLPASAAFVVAQGLGEAGEPVTLVTAPDAATLVSGVAALTEPAAWRSLSGGTLYLDGVSGAWTSRPAGHQAIVPLGPLTFSNLRMTAAAWLSMNTPVYAGLLVLAGLLFGALTYASVRRHGVRTAP
jgi:hypothetical protein